MQATLTVTTQCSLSKQCYPPPHSRLQNSPAVPPAQQCQLAVLVHHPAQHWDQPGSSSSNSNAFTASALLYAARLRLVSSMYGRCQRADEQPILVLDVGTQRHHVNTTVVNHVASQCRWLHNADICLTSSGVSPSSSVASVASSTPSGLLLPIAFRAAM